MSIAEFFRENVLRPRLKESGCMVVYDKSMRYKEQCFDLDSDEIIVVDAASSSIESREAALKALAQVGDPKVKRQGLLIYVPADRPESDEQKQADPFAIYAESGTMFPREDGDEYLNLCLRAKPDNATEIRQLFSDSPSGPTFEVIDAIGGGNRWPLLRATLNVESGREILEALLVPSAPQLSALKRESGWIKQAKDFLQVTLNMSVITRSKSWLPLADELWRYVLFSELGFDLDNDLPESLHGVPRAPVEAQSIVYEVCDRLRSDRNSRTAYIDRAQIIESELELSNLLDDRQNVGDRDIFPFQEKALLRTAINGIANDDTKITRAILIRRKDSVWLGVGESQAQWDLVRSALSLVESCEDFERQLPNHSGSQADLLDFYVESLREADRLQREFEQAAGVFLDQESLMEDVVQQARSHYRRLAEKVQGIFIRHIESTGWPPPDRLANVDVFDKFVTNRLKDSGRKIAYLMIDALRYELGVALKNELAEDLPVELTAAHAQLPSITLVGMASLLPGASTGLTLTLDKGELLPKLDGSSVGNVKQRMSVLNKRYGDRFSEMLLVDFVRGKPKKLENVDLLVLRSTEIDQQLENNPETTLGLIPATLNLIRGAIYKLRRLGFTEAVIVTDHGFFLNAQAEAGDVCQKPNGKWPVQAHDRMMLGDGSSDDHNLVISAASVGIRGDFSQVGLPRSMAPYRSGYLYFHGGASLAESVVPVLTVRLDHTVQSDERKAVVELNYKNGAKRITTRIPVVEVMLVSDDMFSPGSDVEILLEAQDSKGNVVGEPGSGSDVNPATRTVSLLPGVQKQIAIRMDDEFRGKFSVKALNPTTLAAYSSLAIETDYTE